MVSPFDSLPYDTLIPACCQVSPEPCRYYSIVKELAFRSSACRAHPVDLERDLTASALSPATKPWHLWWLTLRLRVVSGGWTRKGRFDVVVTYVRFIDTMRSMLAMSSTQITEQPVDQDEPLPSFGIGWFRSRNLHLSSVFGHFIASLNSFLVIMFAQPSRSRQRSHRGSVR